MESEDTYYVEVDRIDSQSYRCRVEQRNCKGDAGVSIHEASEDQEYDYSAEHEEYRAEVCLSYHGCKLGCQTGYCHELSEHS